MYFKSGFCSEQFAREEMIIEAVGIKAFIS
jgi:hypothetical protein